MAPSLATQPSEKTPLNIQDPKKDKETFHRAMGRLRAQVGDDVYMSWFARMDLDHIDGTTVSLTVATRFLKSWIQSHYIDKVLACWQAENEQFERIELSVRSAVLRTNLRPINSDAPKYDLRSAPFNDMGQNGVPIGSPLDPRLIFENFVVGVSNSVAHAAAQQIAVAKKTDRAMCNPLYFCAHTGLGKTHLLQAIAAAGNQSGERKMLYFTADRFMYCFVRAVKNESAFAFKEALNNTDVLIIDDVQFLQGKSSQAEFCHAVNSLIDAGRQVVIAADRPPSDLESFDNRTRSRLSGGLVVEMSIVSEDLRLGILKAKVLFAKQHHPSFDVPLPVLLYIAKTLTNSGRDLEAAVNRLLAHNKLTEAPVTLEMAEREVRDLVCPQEPKRVKIEDIQRVVAHEYNVSRADILSPRRTANVVRPRQVAMYLAKILTLRSLPDIGRRFGGRDHTTVLHAVRKIEGLVGNDNALAEEVEALKLKLLS